jgi:hypothetical protein
MQNSKIFDDSPNFRLKEYSTRIGSQTIPAIKPNTRPQFLSELERALGTVSNLNSNSSYTPQQVQSDETVIDNSIGVETESYSNADMSSTYQGMNTSTSDIFFTPTFNPQDSRR